MEKDEVIILTIQVDDPDLGKYSKIHSIHATYDSVVIQIERLKKDNRYMIGYDFSITPLLNLTREHNET